MAGICGAKYQGGGCSTICIKDPLNLAKPQTAHTGLESRAKNTVSQQNNYSWVEELEFTNNWETVKLCLNKKKGHFEHLKHSIQYTERLKLPWNKGYFS